MGGAFDSGRAGVSLCASEKAGPDKSFLFVDDHVYREVASRIPGALMRGNWDNKGIEA